VFGTYVSHGDVFDARTRAFLGAYHVTSKDAPDAAAYRVAVVKAWKDGDALPPALPSASKSKSK